MRDVGELLQTTLDSFVSKLCAREGFPIPGLQYVHTGTLAFDCEALVVHAVQMYQGHPGYAIQGYQVDTGGVSLHSVDIGVTLIRKSPTLDSAGRIPSADRLTKAGVQAASDGTALAEAFFAAMADNSIAGACDVANFQGITWNGPQGGLLGTMLAMSIQI